VNKWTLTTESVARTRSTLLVLLAFVSGCVPLSAPESLVVNGNASPPDLDSVRFDHLLITRDEIQLRGRNATSAMALIRRLRPRWLSARGPSSFTNPAASYPIVYIDQIRHGGLPTLHSIPVTEILSLEFHSMADATIRWGTGHTSGVINIVTGRF